MGCCRRGDRGFLPIEAPPFYNAHGPVSRYAASGVSSKVTREAEESRYLDRPMGLPYPANAEWGKRGKRGGLRGGRRGGENRVSGPSLTPRVDHLTILHSLTRGGQGGPGTN